MKGDLLKEPDAVLSSRSLSRILRSGGIYAKTCKFSAEGGGGVGGVGGWGVGWRPKTKRSTSVSSSMCPVERLLACTLPASVPSVTRKVAKNRSTLTAAASSSPAEDDEDGGDNEEPALIIPEEGGKHWRSDPRCTAMRKKGSSFCSTVCVWGGVFSL